MSLGDIVNMDSIKRLPFLDYLFCFLIVWGSGTQFTIKYSYVYYGIAFLFALIVLSGDFHFKRNMFPPVLVILFLTLISIYLNVQNMGGRGISSTINNFIIIICAILFAQNKPYRNTKRLEIIVKIILSFSILSSFLYFFYVLGLLPMQHVPDSHALHFHHLIIIGESDLGLGNRIGGIYWEPGMYQVFLNFLLIYYLFNDSVKNRRIIILYILTSIVFTVSVSGYALTFIIVGIYAFSNKRRNKFLRYATMLSIFIALLLLFPIVMNLFVAKGDTTSFGKRNLDLVLAWEVFLKKPILGYGIVNDAYQKAYLFYSNEIRPSSNGLMNLLMGTGLIGAVFYFYGYIKTLKFFGSAYTKRMVIPMLIWVIISINTEPIEYQPFISFLIGAGLASCYALNTKGNSYFQITINK